MRKSRIKVPKTIHNASIENFSHDLRGIARIEGKATFIEGALPGEAVSFQYTRRKKDFDDAKVIAVEKASPLRVEPLCPHYQVCGGCSLQHLAPQAQIQQKEAILLELLSRIGHTSVESLLPAITSEPWNYRNKARLSVRYVEKKEAALVGFREKYNPRYIAEIQRCPILNARVDKDILALRALVDSLEDKACIAQIEVAAGDTDIALILRNLSPLSASDEFKIRNFADEFQYKIFLQPGNEASVYLFHPQNTTSFLTYALPEHRIEFQFYPTDFTQINAVLNHKMVNQALSLLDLHEDDVVLDLFCGLGNFSLPIARYCAEVVGVEGSATMVERAAMNAKNNGLGNTEFFAANLEDPQTFASFTHKKYSKLLIDPPRSGALEIVKQIEILNPSRIVYVSCNPVTLARDTEILVQKGYRLISAGVMDMFPHTQHVESIALFEIKR